MNGPVGDEATTLILDMICGHANRARPSKHSRGMRARLLTDAFDYLNKAPDICLGMLLQLKKGLAHLYNVPEDSVFVVTQKFAVTRRGQENVGHDSRILDIAVMVWKEEVGGAVEMSVDSRFFEAYDGKVE